MALTASRVLLVGGDDAFLEALGKSMNEAGRVATLVTRGADAIAVAEEGPFDAALLEAVLPDGDGFAVARRLVAARPTLLTLAAADDLTVETAHDAYRAGLSRVLIRPFKLADATRAIRDVLRDRDRRLKARFSRVIARGELSPPAPSSLRVLVVAHDGGPLAAIGARLESMGAAVARASLGQEALHILADHSADVIVMPEDMGDMIATDALMRARAAAPEIAAAIWTPALTIPLLRQMILLDVDCLWEGDAVDPGRAARRVLGAARAACIRREHPDLEELIAKAAPASTSGSLGDAEESGSIEVVALKRHRFVDDTLDLPDLSAATPAGVAKPLGTPPPPVPPDTPPLLDLSRLGKETDTSRDHAVGSAGHTPTPPAAVPMMPGMEEGDHDLEDKTEPSVELSQLLATPTTPPHGSPPAQTDELSVDLSALDEEAQTAIHMNARDVHGELQLDVASVNGTTAELDVTTDLDGPLDLASGASPPSDAGDDLDEPTMIDPARNILTGAEPSTLDDDGSAGPLMDLEAADTHDTEAPPEALEVSASGDRASPREGETIESALPLDHATTDPSIAVTIADESDEHDVVLDLGEEPPDLDEHTTREEFSLGELAKRDGRKPE